MLIQFALDDLFAQERGHIMFVLQNAAVHVHDIHAAVGSVVEAYGAKPFIGGSKPLGLIVCVGAGRPTVFPGEFLQPNHVAAWFRDEGVANKLGGILVASINNRTTGTGPSRQPALAQHAVLVSAINAGVQPTCPHAVVAPKAIAQPIARGMMRIA